MGRLDFRDFIGTHAILVHSAKGSEWENHKYVTKVDGDYYYPSGYENGRTVDSLKGGGKEQSDEESEGDYDLDSMALQVIRGDFGNGQIRKDLLGGDYDKIQSRVNELMKAGNYNSIPMSDASEEAVESGKEKAKKAAKKVDKTVAEKGIDMDEVLSVYKKKR